MPAIAVIAAVLFADHASLWSALLFLAAVLLSFWSRKGVWLVSLTVAILAAALHMVQLRQQAQVTGFVGDWWSGEAVLTEPLANGRAEMLIREGGLEGQKIQAWLPDATEDWEVGQVVAMEGRLIAPRQPLNPGEFDERQWLLRKGVSGVLLVRAFEVGEIETVRYFLKRQAVAARAWAAAQLTRGLDPTSDEVKIIHAMVLGVKPSGDTSLLDAFRSSGAVHVFAVSGLHVMMVGSMVSVVLRFFGCGRKVWIPCVIASMFFYALVTGMRPPAMRAAIMGAIFLSTWLVGRKVVLLNSVAAGGIIALVWDGHMLFQPGFQLSFSVLVAIAILGGLVTKGFHWISYTDPFLPRSLYTHWQSGSLQLRRKVQGAMVVASCAWAGASPLTLAYFRLLAPISIIVSLPMVLLLYCIIFGAGVSLISGTLWSPLGTWMNQWNGQLAKASKTIANVASEVPGGHVYGKPWEGEERVVIYALDGGAAVYLGIGGGVLLDVGSARDFRRKVYPSLKRNVASIDSLVLSHADSQHCGGVAEVLQLFDLKQVVLPESRAQSSSYKRAVTEITQAGLIQSLATSGQILPISDTSCLEVIASPRSTHGLADDRCAVLRLHWNGKKVLFLNDSGYLFEQWAAEKGMDLSADVVVLGSHERDLQVSDAFLESLGAELLVSWSGGECVSGLQTYATSEAGALTITCEDGKMRFKSHLDGHFRIEEN